MAKYFIYFSQTGNGDFIASLLKEQGYEIIKVETKRPIGKANFFNIIKLGGEAGIHKCAKIKEFTLDLKENDEVTIGSPIWNDRLSTPINTVLKKYEFNKETTNFILYLAGSEGKHAAKRLKKLGFKKEPLIILNALKDEQGARDKLGL